MNDVLKKHLILDQYGNYGGVLNRSKYGDGAPLNGKYDVEDSPYYVHNDYYNMKWIDTRTIYPNFSSYQQTMQDSGGIASALMVLNYLGEDVETVHTEEALVQENEEINNTVVYGRGTTSSGLKNLFNNLGYEASLGNYQDVPGTRDEKYLAFSNWIIDNLNQSNFIFIRFHGAIEYGWYVIVGIDTMGTDDYGMDDVLILADPYDNLDHYQDGYYTSGLGRVFRWWQDVEKSGHYSDQFDSLIVSAKTPIEFDRVEDDKMLVQELPERHLILNEDGTMNGRRPEDKNGWQDIENSINPEDFFHYEHPEASYHSYVDYYNLGNTETRYLLPNYKAFQQTMASSCGIASILSVLNYYGEDVDNYSDPNNYDEEFLVNKYNEVNNQSTIYNKGTGSTGLRNLVQHLGYTAQAGSYSRANYVDESSMNFPTYESFLEFVQGHLSQGTPIPVSMRPHGGHWEVIIGIDTMGTDYIYDDVIILADSSDRWDHYRDGYNTLPAALFYRQWYNGSFSYNQQYVVFPKK